MEIASARASISLQRMPPEQQVEATIPTNGTRPATGPVIRPSRNPSVRATLLAGLEKIAPEAPAKAEASEPAEEAPKAEPEKKSDSEPAEEPTEPAEEPEPEPEKADEDPADVAPAKGKAEDPELTKRLAAVQKAERRSREQLAKERAEVDKIKATLEAEWSPRVKAAEKFESLAKRAKHDPAGVLAALGLTDDDMDLAAQQVYSRSPRAKADPKHREAADRALREREAGDRVEQLTKKIEELEGGLKARDAQAVQQREAERYITSIAKAVGDDAPLVASVLAKNPEKARYEFGRIAISLHERDGEMPDAADVIAEYEKARRAELEELGIDPTTAIKARKKAEPADEPKEKRPAKTLGENTRSMTPPSKAAFRERKRDVLRALESEKLE